MGKTKKWVETYRPAIEQLFEDVGRSAYKTFLVHEIPAGVIAPGQSEKVSSVAVMTSGSIDESREWLAIVPLRVDTSGSQGDAEPRRFVHDKDPMTFYLSSTGTPSVSGSVSFHAKYPGRTEDVELVGTPSTVPEAVSDIRARFLARPVAATKLVLTACAR